MATPHSVDRYLELIAPSVTARELRAEVVRAERRTADTITLTLRPTRQWRGFEAGQFVQLGVVVDGVRHTRCFSPAGSAVSRSGLIELTIKAQADGYVTRHLREHAEPGAVYALSQAQGEFHLPTPRPPRIVLVSGGSGITPLLSMARTLVDEKYTGNVTFVHYSTTATDVPYLDELWALGEAAPNVNVVLAYTGDDDGGHLRGFFGTHHLDAVAPWYRDAETYLCGPGPLMHSVREAYRAEGIEDRLHTEEFAPAQVGSGEAGGELTFAASGVRAENTGATLLDQAESAGLSPEYGCRMGICFTCTSVKTSGCTKNVRTGEEDTEPDKPIQLCVSVPVGDVVLDI
ncbi:ferredoxin reductase [Rhodococcus triatomae]|nr:ferredoxin reductase [Rhodococcus triatomae]QNG21243.1 ferredoxin reductase [Rhodococcus triatomae]QNG25468.1 ferredoxin reductase [Rhodococcus triatomae]